MAATPWYTPPAALPFASARLTGDILHEKGRSKQMVCRGSAREFLFWQHRDVEPANIKRGELVQLHPQLAGKNLSIVVRSNNNAKAKNPQGNSEAHQADQ